MPVRSANLPDPRVLEPPPVDEPLEQLPHERPGRVVRRRAVRARLVERVEHLPVDVELELRRGGVPDAHRLRALVARQPVELVLVEAALAGEPVHDLHVGRVAGDGAQEPVAPPDRLVAVARAQHGEQRQGRVAEPAEAVVPVADAADVLGRDVVGAATIPPVGA